MDMGKNHFPESIAVDGQGRVYIGDFGTLMVFAPDGRFIDSFETDGSIDRMVIDQQGAGLKPPPYKVHAR